MMQATKGLWKGEVSYLALLKVEALTGDMATMSLEVVRVLEEFNDVLPTELPKSLPPRKEADHRIELIPEAQPPAMVPYKMALPKLEELRRRLRDLLNANYI